MEKLIKRIIVVFLIALTGGISGAFLYKVVFQPNPEVAFHSTPIQRSDARLTRLTPASPEAVIDFTKAADLTVHAVVHVKTYYDRQNNYYNPYNPFHDFFWGDPRQNAQPGQPEASGSGVILSDDGYIVTNNHVVNSASKIEVTLNDKRTYVAKVIGTDPSTDLALLKIDEKALPYVTYGNSDELRVGEWVLAVGNPFNLTSTVTAGIVSAKARDINILNSTYKIEAFIQTDAAVNPGNSGGALVNTSGQLVGINAAIASNTGSYTGYSFAIPATIVKKVVNDLLEFGEVQRGFIGVNIRDIDNKLVAEKGIKQIKGVYVDGLKEGGSATEAGIEKGDVITQIGDVPVNSAPELQEQISRYRPGDKVNISIIRKDEERIIPVILKNKKGTTDVVRKEKNEIISLLGADFEQISADEQARLGIDGGVKVKKLSVGKLRSAGIREGFIITKIDRNKDINTTDDLVDALQNKKGGVLIEGVFPNGMSAYYAFGL